MPETLGSLCDKLSIIKLKQWHSKLPERLSSLAQQEIQLKSEIDEFLAGAMTGSIPLQKLSFVANKVYNQEQNIVREFTGSIAEIVSHLAHVNCDLWHEVDKGYEIEKLPIEMKDGIVKQIALLNLERNQCIDKIDGEFQRLVEQRSANSTSSLG